VQFSVFIWPHSEQGIEPVIRLGEAAEAEGYESVYVGDSQLLWNDAWICLAGIAMRTEKVRLSTGVTNLISRHPSVTANAAVSLNMLSNGRAVLGLAAGDSALRTAGLSPAPLKLLRERVPQVRRLMAGEEVPAFEWYDPRPEKAWGVEGSMRLQGVERWGNVPIEWAILRPQACEAAAELADGVILTGNLGANVEGVRTARAALERGAERAGKDPSTVRLISSTEIAIDDDRDKALNQVKPTAARLVANVGYLPDTIKLEHAEEVQNVKDSYKFYEHLDLTARHQELVSNELAKKTCIAGTVQDCIEQCRELGAAGITDIGIFITSQDEDASRTTLERFAREVVPHI
jgi:5,10-methylenetetrahydromethanopterin reductase